MASDDNSNSIWPDLAAGLITGISIVLWCFTLAALIFEGDLAPFMARGAGFILLGAAVLALTVALTSSYPATISAPCEAAGVIIGLVASSIAASATVDGESKFATVMAVIVVSSLLSGFVFAALGALKLGDAVRFIPHPVIGGVVVTMGWLLVSGAFAVMTDFELAAHTLPRLFTSAAAPSWAPGTLMAVVLLVAARRWKHALVLPCLLIAAIGVYYAIAVALGFTVDDLRAHGWLLEPLPTVGIGSLADADMIARVDWWFIVGAVPDIASLLMLSGLLLLLGATALEVAARTDIDLNRELVSTGLANILSGLCGGITGSHSLDDCLIAREMHAKRRMVGVVTAVVCAAVLLFGVGILAYLPKTLLGGFILFFGLVLLHEWVVEGWRRLPRADYVVVILCLVVSIWAGYLAGVGAGIIAGVMIFVFNYSRIDVIKHAVSGADFHSNVERNRLARESLDEQGDSILVLKLQGFIFFGTAHRIYTEIRNRLDDADRPPLAFVLLDFRSVSGMDTSTTASLEKMKHLAENSGFVIVLSNLGNDVATQLEKSGALSSGTDPVRIFADSDRGLEWCENRLLRGTVDTRAAPGGIEDILEGAIASRDMIAQLLPYLEPRTIASGEHLIRQGEPSTDLFFVEQGRVTIQLEISGRAPVRLRSMGAGTVVGEVALYLREPRSASVVAEEEVRAHRLTLDALDRMTKQNPALATAFNEFIVRLLGTRLVETNRMLRAMMD